MQKKIEFCSGGGCTAKLGPEVLSRILEKIPKQKDDNLLVGFNSSDDASVYRLSDDLLVVQTLDFFPPVVKNPYVFGQIAAANAMSDVYAMGGEVKTALNIVSYPEKMDMNYLGEILLGGSEKVAEAGGILTGGHSISGDGVIYGLSVMGTVKPQKFYRNNRCRPGDKLILTKPLGVGIITTADRVGEASSDAMEKAVKSMTTLNKYAARIIGKYNVSACTDVTGFGFLGHLSEMVNESCCALVNARDVPFIDKAYDYANEFLLTAAGQRNRNFVGKDVDFKNIGFAMEEIMFDPQTSGGLLVSVAPGDEKAVMDELSGLEIKPAVVGVIAERTQNMKKRIYVKG